jgi:hypothetical protein
MQPDVQPAPQAQPPTQPAQAQPAQGNPNTPPVDSPQEQAQAFPPALLKRPAIQALIAGSPAAVSMPIEEFKHQDAAKEIVEHKEALEQAGFGFYKSHSGHTGVVFNSFYVHPQDIQAADKMGKLELIAPPWNKVDHEVGTGDPSKHPALGRMQVPSGPALPTPQTPPQQATGAMQEPNTPLPSKVQQKLLAARIAQSQPGAPTSGPSPGGGRLLAQILKPVI